MISDNQLSKAGAQYTPEYYTRDYTVTLARHTMRGKVSPQASSDGARRRGATGARGPAATMSLDTDFSGIFLDILNISRILPTQDSKLVILRTPKN